MFKFWKSANFISKDIQVMLESTATWETDELFVIGESRKRKFENDSYDSETASIIEVEDSD